MDLSIKLKVSNWLSQSSYFAFHISQDKNVDPYSKMFIPLKILHKSFILLWDGIKMFAFLEKSKLTVFQASFLKNWI